MKYFAYVLLLAFAAAAYAGKLPVAPELKPESAAVTQAESSAEARNKRGLLYSSYAAPYAAAYGYPSYPAYTAAYSYPVAYTAAYRSYYPSYYGSLVIA